MLRSGEAFFDEPFIIASPFVNSVVEFLPDGVVPTGWKEI